MACGCLSNPHSFHPHEFNRNAVMKSQFFQLATFTQRDLKIDSIVHGPHSSPESIS
jgi:hypothetical protein